MAVTFASDTVAVEHLIQEITRPIGHRRASTEQVKRSLMGRSNRRGAPRVNLVSSDIAVRLGNETVSGVDFSLRGIQFRCATRVVPGSTVLLNLQWREEKPAVALGRVMWATFERPTHTASPHYRVGVAFETVDTRLIRTMLQESGFGRVGTEDMEVV